MKKESKRRELRAQLDALRNQQGRLVRYPQHLKNELITFIDLLQNEGFNQRQACLSVGISPGTFKDWKKKKQSQGTSPLKSVQVLPDNPLHASSPSSLSLVFPNGVRVEGVTFTQVVEAMRSFE